MHILIEFLFIYLFIYYDNTIKCIKKNYLYLYIDFYYLYDHAYFLKLTSFPLNKFYNLIS